MFEERLRDILRLKAQGMTSQAVKECSAIVEQVLETFYKEIWFHLNSDEKQELLNNERKFSRRKTPVATLGLGRWINFYEESKLPQLLSRHRGVNSDAFDFERLTAINEIRNKCTHDNYVASQGELEETYDYTIQLLKMTSLIRREPVEIRHTAEEKPRSESAVWTDKIRLLLASAPLFEFQEVFEKDYGKFYDIYGKYEFVGAFCKENIVYILLVESSDSGYHEDVMEDVHEKVAELVKERLSKNMPELHDIKIVVSITDDISDLGYISIELDF